MSKIAFTIFVFGLYLVGLGIVLLVVPNLWLGIFQIPATHDIWIRILGMLLFYLGIYYILAARKEMTDFFRWTVYLRSTVILFLITFVLLGFGKPIIILIGIIDFMGAVWTWLALRVSK
ncbi:MAG: hypothetical protein IPP66_16795 [Anaerolineales bacterium]|nr:hypothetical protein [Anaerolineales bacterium]